MMLHDRLEDIEHARFRALAQLLIDKTEGAKAFEAYIKIAFPSAEQRKKQQDQNLKKILFDWTSRGPLKVTPIAEPRATSKMKSRAVRVQNDLADRVYNKVKLH
jgi:hypothetical protein